MMSSASYYFIIETSCFQLVLVMCCPSLYTSFLETSWQSVVRMYMSVCTTKETFPACTDMDRHSFVHMYQGLVAAILGKETVAIVGIKCTAATKIRNSDRRPAMPVLHQMIYRSHLIRESVHSFRLNARHCQNLCQVSATDRPSSAKHPLPLPVLHPEAFQR